MHQVEGIVHVRAPSVGVVRCARCDEAQGMDDFVQRHEFGKANLFWRQQDIPWKALGGAINSSGDALGSLIGFDNAFVYTDEHGLIELDDLVVGTAEDLAIWFESRRNLAGAINDRDQTGFGQICGTTVTLVHQGPSINLAFLLTPVAP